MNPEENNTTPDNASKKKENVEKTTEVGEKSVDKKSLKEKTPQETIEELRSELDTKLKEKDKLIEEWKKNFSKIRPELKRMEEPKS